MSQYGITVDGIRIGTVARFAGEPKRSRWVAYSIHDEAKEKFPTRRQASAWLVKVHEERSSNGNAKLSAPLAS